MTSSLQQLETEAIYIFREVAAEFEKPVMLYSIGKDSSVMLHIAKKAFSPAPLPFPLLHIDTKWKFREMISFRDSVAKQPGIEMLVYSNPDGQEMNISPFVHGSKVHTEIMKTQALKNALNMYGFDAAFGGARRDEEKSRAKERIFSFRNENHVWNPKKQRPELWDIYNCKINQGESIRVFPLSNWTELDIWQYIAQENIEIPSLYFASFRPVVKRENRLLMVDDARMPINDAEQIEEIMVRFRTLGCYPLTGAMRSEAVSVKDIIDELLVSKSSERQSRVIDHDENSSMEMKKRQGYF